METSAQNSALLLTNLLPAQGAGLAVANPSQGLDKAGNVGAESFLSSLQTSLKALLANPQEGGGELDSESLSAMLTQLLDGNAANPDAGLPLLEGQEFAAGLTQEQLTDLVTLFEEQGISFSDDGSLAFEGQALADLSQEQLAELAIRLDELGIRVPEGRLEALARVGEQQPDTAKQNSNAVTALLAQISSSSGIGRLVSSQVSEHVTAHSESHDDQAAVAGLDEKRLQEKLNAVLSRPLTQNATVKEKGAAIAVSGLNADMAMNQLNPSQSAVAASAQVATPIPVLLERFASLSAERQAANDMPDLLNGRQLDAGMLQQPGRVISNMTPAAEARPLQSFIQTPLTEAQQWQTDFSNRVVMMTKGLGQGQVQVAEIRLNPQHMGAIEVRVVMNDDQASVSFMSQHGAVREAIESSLPRLREMFNGTGVVLADADVSEQSLHQRRQSGDHTGNGNQQGQSGPGFGYDDLGDQLIGQIDLSTITSSSLSSLDLYA